MTFKRALDDMVYFVHRHVERINEYQRFAAGLLKYDSGKTTSSPDAFKPLRRA